MVYNQDVEQMFGRLKIMTFSFIFKTLFELALVIAVFWCIFHEDRLISFEKNIAALFRRRKFRVIREAKPSRSYEYARRF